MLKLWMVCAVLFLGSPVVAAPKTSEFTLMALDPPPPVEHLYASYAEAGLTTIALGPGEGLEEAVDLASSHGLSVFIANPGTVEGAVSAWVALAKEYPAVSGWLLNTSVAPEDLEATARKVRALRELGWSGTTLAFIDSGGEDPEDIANPLLEAGLSAFGLRALTMGRAGTWDSARYFRNLALGRRLSQKRGAKWIGFIQVTETKEGRFASESDLRVQVYTHLAFGVRGLAYYRFWLPIRQEDWDADPGAGMRRTMVNPRTGERHYTWKKVTEVNREVHTLWPTLRSLAVDEVFFVGKTPEGMKPLPFGKRLVRAVTAQSALVSFLRDRDGRMWAFVVNSVHGMRRSAVNTQRTLRIQLDESVSAVSEMDRHSGELKPLKISRNEVYLTLPGGTGALLRFTTGETDTPTAPEHQENGL
jgi:hypothetical protein